MKPFMRSFNVNRGFTLVELMIGIALMAILLTIAVPSFRDATLGSQLSATSNNLMAGAYLARSEALKRNRVVTLCSSSDGVSCDDSDWHQGWIVLADTPLSTQGPISGGVTIQAGAMTRIDFQPTGIGATPVAFRVCRAMPTAGRQERIVTIDATGRPWTRRATTGICP